MNAQTSAASPIPEHVPAERVFDFDMYFDERLKDDVHLGYRSLHRDAPDIFFTPRNGGHWVVIRQDLLRQMMVKPEIFSSEETAVPRGPSLPLPPQDMDPPEHGKYRLLLMPYLARNEVPKLEPLARQLAADLINALDGKSSCDFVTAFAVQMPVKLFMTLMGMDLSRFEEFVGWVHSIFMAADPNERQPAYIQLTKYLTELIHSRMEQPGDDPVSHLLASKIDGEPLPFERVLAMCNLLFLAGLDTVTNAMGFMARHLGENVELQRRLRHDPSLIPQAIEELMRRFTFVNSGRLVVRDTELGGAKLRAGDMVIGSLAAASLDDRATPNPEQVDIDRARVSHVAFNTGPHNCAGAWLARMELKVFLEEWLRRIPEFRVAPGFKAQTRAGIVMGLKELPLVW